MEFSLVNNFIGQDLNFLDEVGLWFHFSTDGALLVCFRYIEEPHIYKTLRSLCMKYDSGDRVKGTENGEPIYCFKIPPELAIDCYEELKKLSI